MTADIFFRLLAYKLVVHFYVKIKIKSQQKKIYQLFFKLCAFVEFETTLEVVGALLVP